MNRIWKRIIAFGVLAAVILAFYLADVLIARSYRFELIETSSDVFVADGQSTVKITVKLSRRGKPVEGHTIYIYASNGTLPSSRMVTDADGLIQFRYVPYVYFNEELTPLEDVTIYLQDESNSIVFMVCAKESYTFTVVESDSELIWEDWQELTVTEGIE